MYADPRRLERVWGPPSHPATFVDRYHLLVFPLLLGTGKRLLTDATALDKTRPDSTSPPPTPTGSPCSYDVVR